VSGSTAQGFQLLASSFTEEDVSLSKSPAIADSTLAQLRLLLHGLLQALQYEVAIVRCFVISTTQFSEWCQQAVAQVECLETHAMGVTSSHEVDSF
jgi:hypothetical protein